MNKQRRDITPQSLPHAGFTALLIPRERQPNHHILPLFPPHSAAIAANRAEYQKSISTCSTQCFPLEGVACCI